MRLRSITRFPILLTMVALTSLTATVVVVTSFHYRIGLLPTPEQLARVGAAPLLAWWHRGDLVASALARENCWLGRAVSSADAATVSWRRIGESDPRLGDVDVQCRRPADSDLPFV